jgi:hypothetical protein
MFVKIDFAPTLTGQRPVIWHQMFPTAILRQPVVKSVLNASQAILTVFAVFNGLPGSPDDLEKMGIYFGPSHS